MPTRPNAARGVELVVVDEWHELMGNKRGVQVQLALARLRMFAFQRAAHSAAVPRLEAGAGGGGLNRPPTVAESPST